MINHTFVVLAYKDSPYLKECLDSLKNQTVKSDIYISTSTPSVYIREIAELFGIKVYVSRLPSSSMNDCNFAFRQAKTKYVTLAHQDDLYLPQYAETCIAAANNYNDTLICFTNYSEFTGGADKQVSALLKVKRLMLWIFMPLKKHMQSRFWKMKLLAFGNPISAPTIMYNLEKMPGYQFNSSLIYNLDWEEWYKLSKEEGRFIYLPEILVKRRMHSESATTRGLKNNLSYAEDLKMFKLFWPTVFAKLIVRFYSTRSKSNSTD